MANNGTPTTPGGPLSFKTVPGRHRTQKWNTAPKNTYDGDDWGDYDPYDEYGGGYEDPEPPLPTQSSALPTQKLRKHSFDRGDDGARSVSAPFPAQQQAPVTASPIDGGSSDFPRSGSRPRDFTNPDQAPAPLNASRDAVPAPPGFFPPRKTSMGANTFEAQQQAAEARAIAESVSSSAANNGAASSADGAQTDKPLPFIRPSDIYKRMDEERRRESEDSGRPSVDALERVTSAEQRRNELPPVEEQAERVQIQSSGPDEPDQTTSSSRNKSPTLPLVSRFSGFGDDILTFTGSTSTEQTSKPSPPGLDTAGLGTASSSIQPTPTTTHPPSGISRASAAAEQHGDDGLQHTPSVGFRSAVHQAFDQNDASLSRDNSGSTPSTDVGRSDTSSTAGISPIMSRVPSAATAAFTQRQRDGVTPTIAEESTTTPTASRPGSDLVERVGRQPPADRSASGERVPTTFEPGYRRSLDPPSSGTSPARTPAVETVESRRLSTPLSGVIGADDPDVADQGAEVVKPDLHPVETLASNPPTSAIPIAGRGRSNTDYSIREADLANTINSSPDKDPSSPELAEAAKESRDSRDLFLRTHDMPPATSPVRTGTPSRSDSPAKGRVREIADKYQEIHESRRGSNASIGSSKSGWSTFTDDAKPKPRRAGTGQSGLGQGPAPPRPEIGREESFKPDLPGGWINSEAPTPAVETPPAVATRNIPSPDEPIDLTPTTQKHQLQGPATKSPIDATKEVGDQLGAAFISQYGVGHQTRDFASKEAPAPVDQSEAMPKRIHGEVLPAPPLLRQETDSTDAPTSVSSSAAPTPLAKDTPQPAAGNGNLGTEYFNTVAPLRVRSREPSPEHSVPQQPSAGQPLRRTSSDSADDDRIRAEIVRSLDSSADNNVRTQDALNAPDNERRVEHGESALPAAAATAAAVGVGAAAVAAASTSTPKTDSTRPGLLNTRFSWEMSEPVKEEPKSPEIKPEAAYERPRSKQLHIMNPGETPITPDTPAVEQRLPELTGTIGGPLSVPDVGRPEAAAAEGEIVRSLSQRVKGPVSPVAKTQDTLNIPQTTAESGQSLQEGQPSPVSDRSPRIPPYYAESTQDTTNAAPSTASPQQQSSAQFQGQIPAFRNILQIKDADERIKTYNSTRQVFADMNTGLGDWLQSMTARHPDVQQTAEQGRPPPLEPSVSASNTNSWKRGHRAAAPSMNLSNLKNRFASGGQAEGSGRTASAGGGPSGLSNSDNAGGSGGVDLDRVQQKGKEFMKNAGVFGSKAGAGAKGLLAKGKSRFGGSHIITIPANVRVCQLTYNRASSSVLAKLRSASSPASPSKSRNRIGSGSQENRRLSTAAPAAANTVEQPNDSPFPVPDNNPKAPGAADELPNSTVAPAPAALGKDEKTAFEGDVHDERGVFESRARLTNSGDVLAADPDSGLHESAISKGQAPPGATHLQIEDEREDKRERVEPDAPTTTIAALAEQISEAETRSEAVKELQEAGPVLEDVTTASPVSISGPTTLTASTHIPSAALPTASDSPVPGHQHTSSSDSIDLASALTMAPNIPKRLSTMDPATVNPEHKRSYTADTNTIPLLSTPDLPSTSKRSPSATANRPDAARRTSTSGLLALRSSARREGSATPTNGSSSSREPSRGWTQGGAANPRPLSGVFERLKERTARSWSRSRSRPQSLVFWKGGADGTSSSADDIGAEKGEVEDAATGSAARPQSALMDFSDVAVDPTRPAGTAVPSGSLPLHGSLPSSPQRIEAWNEPGAKLPTPKTPDAKGKISPQEQERLGVLPSPAPTAATFADAEHMRRGSSIDVERQRRKRSSVGNNSAFGSVSEEANWKKGLEERYAGDSSSTTVDGRAFATAGVMTGEPLETVPSQEEFEEKTAGVMPPTLKDDGPTSASARSSPTKRPMQNQRKVSDISTLPSQMHRRAASEGVSPVKQTFSTTIPTNEGSNASPMLSGNESQISELSDVEVVTAEPMTMRPVEAVVVQGGEESAEEEATPTAKRSGSSRWEREIAEQEKEVRRLERVQSAESGRSVAPGETSPRERPAGGTFASIIASATARKEKLQKPQLVEAQHNPYVLPSEQNPGAASARPTSEGQDRVGDRWEDARSEVSAEEGASDDRRSSVSSFGEGENVRPATSRTNTGLQPAAAEKDKRAATGQSSPNDERNMPSSFETVRAAPEAPQQAQQPPPLVIEEPMTSQAIPAGPTTNTASPTSPSSAGLMPGVRQPSLGTTDFQKRFSQRLYAQRPDMGERPMSYMTLPRDEGGFVQEEIDTRNAASASTKSLDAASAAPAAIANANNVEKENDPPPFITEDLSALSGPPAGTAPFQQHPLFRQHDAGYFPDGSQQPMSAGARIPGRDVISDDHGLEDVHAWGDNVVTTPQGEHPPSGNASNQPPHARKKSGTWKAAFRSNKPLASLENSDNVNAGVTAGGEEMDRMDTVRKVSGGAKRTLQKPQRASSSAVKLSSSGAEGEPKEKEKKKRFSGLKSLLGRASTSAGTAAAIETRPGHARHQSERERSRTRDEKGRKLTKAAPPLAPAGPAPLQSQWHPGNSATVKGGVGSYAEYEHARKKEMAAFAEQSERSQRILARREAGRQDMTMTGAGGPQEQAEMMSPTNIVDGAPSLSPPADGWYGPSARKTHVDETEEQGYTMPEFQRTDRQQVAAEQRRAAAQTGNPLPLRDYAASPPPAIDDQQRSAPGTRDGRFGSIASVPVSGRSEFFATGQRPLGSVDSSVSPVRQRPFGSMSSATISPVHGNAPPLQIQTQGQFGPSQQQRVSPRDRVISMGTEVARSPAKEYRDQQTPFAITLPGAGEASAVQSNDAAWNEAQARAAYDVQQQYQYAEPDYERVQYQQPQSPLYSAGGEGRYPPGQRPHNGFNYEGRDTYSQQQGYDYDRRMPSPPTSPMYDNSHYARQPPPQQRNWMSQQVFQQGQQYSHPAQSPMYQAQRTEPASQSGWFPRHQQQQLQYHENEQRRRRANSIEQQEQQRRRANSMEQQQQRRYYSQNNGGGDLPHYAPPQQQLPKPNFSHPPLSAAMQQQQQRQFMRGEDGGVDYYGGVGPGRGGRRRAGSGYSGRRDDPAVSEDEVDMIMRGASYPGMEWDPYSGRR
ncbi:hypothetical protein CKM354_000207100 [Cercospora kikuchii]|uniref:Uncharacterized protein n=1 Tax=Cercospora kikuchii TaxID=84275 RepID=A0A9P3CBS8_9PEZI|nr:uncharacterized protein CKM354_000207100 [Cercospora kikuchii]GIZ38661.1 hypothetical protein CKM354_000207100 [Cercospora kikuchii]